MASQSDVSTLLNQQLKNYFFDTLKHKQLTAVQV